MFVKKNPSALMYSRYSNKQCKSNRHFYLNRSVATLSPHSPQSGCLSPQQTSVCQKTQQRLWLDIEALLWIDYRKSLLLPRIEILLLVYLSSHLIFSEIYQFQTQVFFGDVITYDKNHDIKYSDVKFDYKHLNSFICVCKRSKIKKTQSYLFS